MKLDVRPANRAATIERIEQAERVLNEALIQIGAVERLHGCTPDGGDTTPLPFPVVPGSFPPQELLWCMDCDGDDSHTNAVPCPKKARP